MSQDDVSPSEIASSFHLIDNRKMIFKANQGEGKSGSFFFHSKDRKFIIKTLKDKEKVILLNMLDDLFEHFRKNKGSLLTRIYGIFTIKTQYFDPVDLIIMRNTAYVENQNEKMVFDIKGSTKGRMTKLPDKRFSKVNFNQNSVLKDLNFLKINKDWDNTLLKLSRDDRDKLLDSVKKDSEFLRKKGLMDYSLLVVIEKLNPKIKLDLQFD